MPLTYHKSVADAGGAIGVEIFSGVVDTILPKILLSEQTSGMIISRKFYIANSDVDDVTISNLSMDSFTVFSTILFEGTGDTQVVGDLTGSEVDESPISVTIPASGHKSFWLQVTVPALSTETSNYNTVDVKQTL